MCLYFYLSPTKIQPHRGHFLLSRGSWSSVWERSLVETPVDLSAKTTTLNSTLEVVLFVNFVGSVLFVVVTAWYQPWCQHVTSLACPWINDESGLVTQVVGSTGLHLFQVNLTFCYTQQFCTNWWYHGWKIGTAVASQERWSSINYLNIPSRWFATNVLLVQNICQKWLFLSALQCWCLCSQCKEICVKWPLGVFTSAVRSETTSFFKQLSSYAKPLHSSAHVDSWQNYAPAPFSVLPSEMVQSIWM